MTDFWAWWSGDKRPYDYDAIMRETRERDVMTSQGKRIEAVEMTIAKVAGDMTQMREDMVKLITHLTGASPVPAPVHTEKAPATEIVGTPSAPLYTKAYKPTCHTHGCPRPSGKGFTANGKAHHLRNNPTHDVS